MRASHVTALFYNSLWTKITNIPVQRIQKGFMLIHRRGGGRGIHTQLSGRGLIYVSTIKYGNAAIVEIDT